MVIMVHHQEVCQGEVVVMEVALVQISREKVQAGMMIESLNGPGISLQTEVSFFFFLSRGLHRMHKERFLSPFSNMCKYVPSVFCRTIISLHSMRKYNLSFLGLLLLSGLLNE